MSFRLGLIDFSSSQSIWMQKKGASDWISPLMGVTGTGSDSNGATNDVCVQVPSRDCVVRIQMYVKPMGRGVIFYESGLIRRSVWVQGRLES